MTSSPSAESSIKGSIIGVCVCDALGGPVQFQSRGSFKPVEKLEPVTHFLQPTGAWSDDGSMTLCLAQSLIDTNGKFSAEDLLRHWTAWYSRGHLSSADGHAFDVGVSTSIALSEWAKHMPPLEKAQWGKHTAPGEVDIAGGQAAIDRRLKKESNSGNGSLMRASPVGLMYFSDTKIAFDVAKVQSDLTHPSPVCADACILYTMLICMIVDGVKKGSPPSRAQLAAAIQSADIPDPILAERLAKYPDIAAWSQRKEIEVPASGWVVDTIEAALWAFFSTDNFKDGALCVVNLGDDSDSTGAVYGGLAGSFYGTEAIPEEWRKGVVKARIVEGIADKFAKVALHSGT